MARKKLPVAEADASTRDARIPSAALPEGWSILEHLPFPVLEIRDDYSVGRANRACEAHYGRMEGMCYQLSHARDFPCNEAGEACPKAEATSTGRDVTVRHAHVTKDGVHVFLVSAYPLEQGGILEFHLPIEETLGRDGLTGLYSRDFFDQLVARQLALLARMDLPYSVVLLDIDDFKRVNDYHGHAIGDVVLREFGKVLASECREGDSAGRYGGEEFCVFMPGSDLAGANVYAERLQKALSDVAVDSGNGILSPTASFGIWSGSATVPALRAMEAADSALYEAKRAGRDRISLAPE
ncbi:MAG: GGDEF domain-containing protein [Myxococcales bacterium]|nr:GGDEF domain-containing protein [Myxococcales bacterium]